MIRVQDHDAVHGARQDRVIHPRLSRHGVQHIQEVFRIAQIIARIHEGLADGILIGPSRNGRHFRNQAEGRDFTLARIIDVQIVVIEGRQSADHTAHYRHRVRVAAEAVKEAAQLFVQHGVIGHTLAKFLILRGIGQIAIQQQIGNFEEARFFGQLINGIAAIQQNAGIAINIGDGAFAGSGRAIAGVEGENPKIAIKLADIGNLRPQRAAQQGQRRAFVGTIQRDGNGPLGLRGHACLPQKRSRHQHKRGR